MLDGIIIGGGIVGCALAEALQRIDGRWLLLEAGEDVASGASKANSGIVHAGFDAASGSKKAFYNVRGSEMYLSEAKRFGVPYRRNGSIVAAFDDHGKDVLGNLLLQGERNGVKGLRLLSRDETLKMEPKLSPKTVMSLYAPSGAIVSPYEMTLAYAYHAAECGVEFVFDSPAEEITHDGAVFRVKAGGKTYSARCVVNCAGCGAEAVRRMMSDREIRITPRRGQYYLFDRAAGCPFDRTVFQTPTPMGKGVLVTPTVHGNLLIGPTAEDIKDMRDTATTAAGLKEVIEKAALAYPEVSLRDAITAFAGVRAHEAGGDFIVGAVPGAPEGAFEAVGIESPGLTAAPAIAADLAAQIASFLKKEIGEERKAPTPMPKPFSEMTDEEKQAAWEKDRRYGSVVCRCEEVTEAEILDAVHRPVGARSVDGVKRRVRAGMGRCQGGFCSPRVLEILCREWNMDPTEITKCGGNSRIVTGRLGQREETRHDQ